jgi:ATP-dependent Clp protease ATP-binding subunit ClpC
LRHESEIFRRAGIGIARSPEADFAISASAFAAFFDIDSQHRRSPVFQPVNQISSSGQPLEYTALRTALLLFLIVVLAKVINVSRRRWALRRQQAALAAQQVQTPQAVIIAPAEQPLAGRLHQLENAVAGFAANSAHPRELREHPDFQTAVDLLANPAVSVDVVMQYALGGNWVLSCAALAALARRNDSEPAAEQIVAHFDRLAVWAMYFALAYFVRLSARPPVGAPAVVAKDWWRDNPVLIMIFREYLERSAACGDAAAFGPALHTSSASSLPIIRAFLERVTHPLAAALIAQLDDITRYQINRGFLTTFGRFWTAQDAQALVEPQQWQQSLATAEATLAQASPRSLLVTGETLVGKTSFLRLTAQRLSNQGWTVFEASGADLMAGQVWFGQLEGRIRQATEEITVLKKLIWYIPNLLALARSGTHQGQSASILDQILPVIAAGRLVIWTESDPTAVARLMQTRPALRSLLEVIRVEAESEENTLALARAVMARLSNDQNLTFEPACADVAVGCARQYLGASGLPGSALHLIKLTTSRDDRKRRVAPDDVLQTLSQLTGLPTLILDNKSRLDLQTTREFFTQRLMGQDEAVASVIDRIAMLKAGLNDPGRPIGVFLCAGPTGTGKTELAKTTAEYLFGSAERLIRLDMSEFQAYDSLNNLLGSGLYGESETLISRVRKQPFSVVLLDEFEKAHPRIWDLFLQVFDDGRLTDTLGQVADFRHCLIILTTNLGATMHQSSGFGFASPPASFTSDQVTRAIRETYRPEFQNRLDKIIVFRPLTRELMRVILRKELNAVLDRRGLKDRAWAVEWEASALEFLLEKGFSPEMGARPLKRAIDQYVIAPLAATIVERRFPEGEQFVFFRSDGRAIQAEFVDPDRDIPAATLVPEQGAPAPNLASMILAPKGTREEHDALAAEWEELDSSLASPQWDGMKEHLSQQMSSEEFWKKADRYEALARLALMDRVAAAAGTAAALRKRLDRSGSGPERYSRELISRLALQIWLVKEGVQDVFEGAAVEVAVMVEPALEGGTNSKEVQAWCGQLRAMYRGWSSSRHMQVEEAVTEADVPILVVSGFGAQRILSRECGLHILEIADGGNSSSRAAARVRLAVTPLEDMPPVKMRAALARAFEQAIQPSGVVRRYRAGPSPLVRNADGSWRSGKFDAVLRGDFDLLPAVEAQS